MDARITLDGWGWRHAGRAAWAVRGLTTTIEPGERVLVLGPSGAGKSTLLHAMAGVLGGADEGEEAGSLLLDGARPAQQRGRTALVMQDPDAQIILARVGDDVAFGLENLAVPRERIWPAVSRALDEVGLDVGLDHDTHHLSGGQQQRLVLAGALAMGADVLLLDEPTANLDPVGVGEVTAAVAKAVADRRRTLIVVEHRIDVWLPLIDRVIVLGPGEGLIADGPPDAVFSSHGDELAGLGAWIPGRPPQLTRRTDVVDSTPVITTADLAVGHRVPVQTGLDLHIARGVSTVITGANGAGKTTLALTLAGLLPKVAGSVSVAPALRPRGLADPISWRSRELLTRIGTVFQEPEHQFVSATVHEELAVGLRALRIPSARIATRVDEMLTLLNLTALRRANPFTLSGGEKRRLSVGTILATQPEVLILDEPTFGQDQRTWLDLIRLIRSQVDEGTTVISVTHDQDVIDVLGENRIDLTRAEVAA